MSIEVLHVTKTFGDHVALDDVSLEAKEGELLALLGPSGSGKTSLLRIMAGLESPDSGSVHFRGEDATNRHARDRGVGFVFQHYALFRHMTVYENIAFGLRVQAKAVRPPDKEINTVVNELLELVQLGWMGDRMPSQLSGGQRQRVALARALAVKPRVLLLDEPFGALDARVRKDLRRWLRQLQDELRVTTVLVTHDQEEALEVADRVVIMNEGRIEQDGSPDEVYSHPKTPFVYSFLGSVNLFHGRLREGRVDIGGGELDAPDWPQAPDQAAVAFVRSHDIEVSRGSRGGSEIAATVRRVRVLGHVVRLDLSESSGRLIEVEMPKARFTDLGLAKGDRVFVALDQAKVFPKGA